MILIINEFGVPSQVEWLSEADWLSFQDGLIDVYTFTNGNYLWLNGGTLDNLDWKPLEEHE